MKFTIVRTLSLCGVVAIWASASAAQSSIRYVGPTADGHSEAVIVGHEAVAHTSQLFPVDKAGALIGEGDVAKQFDAVLENVNHALEEAATSLDQLVKLNVYASDNAAIDIVRKSIRKRFTGDVKPAVTFLATGFENANVRVAVDAVAVVPDSTDMTAVQRIRCSSLYPINSAHVVVQPPGGLLFVAGHPKPGTVAEGTQAALDSIHEYLQFAGLSQANVLQIKSFMTPMEETHVARDVISNFYGESTPPSQLFIEWIADRPCEIALVAWAPFADNADTLEVSQGPNRDPNPAQFSDLSRIYGGETIYCSGIYASDPDMEPVAEIRDIFEQIAELLNRAGSDMRHIANTNYFLTDRETNSHLGEIRPEFYSPDRAPAANRIGVHGLGRTGRTTMFDVVAVTKPE